MKKNLILFSILLILFSNFYSCSTKKTAPKKEVEEAEKLANFYYKLGISYLNSGNIAQAIYNLNKAMELNPKDTQIYNALGIAYSKVNEFDKSQYYFMQALKINPKKPEIYTNLGIVLVKKGQIQDAIKNFKTAISFENYERKEIAYYNLALAYKKLGNLEKYEELLKKAISYNIYFVPAYEALIDYYLEIEETQKAKNLILKAIANGIANAKLYFSLGKIYYLENNYKFAKKYLKKAKLLADKDFILKQKINKIYSEILEKEDSYLKKKKELPPPKIKFDKKKKVEISNKQIPKEVKSKISIPPEKKEINTTIEQKERKQFIEPPKIEKKEESKPEKKSIKKIIRFYIQLGIYSSKKSAIKLKRKLSLYGHKAKLKKRKVGKSIYYVVYIGYFKSYLEASRYYKKKLKPLGFKGIIKFTKIKVENERKQKG